MSRTDEECQFKCGVCRTDQIFDRKFLVKRHIIEQHSGFAYICDGCQMIFPRRENHTSCSGKFGPSRRMCIMRRSDGVSGEEAEREFEQYSSRMERLIIAVPSHRSRDGRRRSREVSLHARGRVSPTRSPAPKSRRVRTPSPVKEKTPNPSPRRCPSPSPSVQSSSSSSSSEASVKEDTKVKPREVKIFELMPGLTLTVDVTKLRESL
jgi:hypothetical protein